ncbi:MAG TPA: 4Fe-4S ferredoxin [Cytophagales bacterium]|nr:4Fe-4S ferredoxin [Cytophagales bacterium]
MVGFTTWIVSLSQSRYRLSESIIKEQVNDSLKLHTLLKESEKLIDKNFSSNIKFVGQIRNALKASNESIVSSYSIPENVATTLAQKSKLNGQWVYKSEAITSLTISEWQKKQLDDYTNWMEGKTYDQENALTEQLASAISNINGQIKYQKGFDDYAMDNLTFWLTKKSSFGALPQHSWLYFFLSIGLIIIGSILYFYGDFAGATVGIKHNNIYHNATTNVGWLGILVGVFMIGFYVVLYFYPEYLTNWVIMVDPLSRMLNGGEASHWFLYGFLYTLAVLVMGIRMFYKYRHNRYHLIRTGSVMFFQLAFAFIIPEILIALNKPGYDFKNIWPLDYDFFYSYNLEQLMASGALGWFMLFWGLALVIVAVPLITYFLGKRWYCSWVCGCGGLAENLGDPYRQLSDKSLKAWKIERWLVHGVLVFAFVNTGAVLYTYFTESYSLLGVQTSDIKTSYGFLISSIFAGVVGTGFYPLMGNRVWCRFGCPLAAYLGIVQRFKSRFRITTNGGQCISCGNCSTYCEMGIDVKWYAQRGQNIVRASCVGCGVCSAVCPRGVLRLENGKEQGRIGLAKF